MMHSVDLDIWVMGTDFHAGMADEGTLLDIFDALSLSIL